eukprot:CAMPEP_0118651760 /NCGR_PEP_ID=MMETSP0785-20121206/10953_1 /TAXON_ID=91992 /ORGANISM="Bolidomonas pacifica, Strain CCMP 1866" /LENGTH=162 /DNA_ID=CAMNT_0006544225 /DNA_START=507 /DNA_END=992 /DNA_ORIENTATION=-
MPRFFDDYGNCYLTHDSAAGRKQQRRGWKFRENFKLYYSKHLDEWRASPAGLAAAQQQCVQALGESVVPPLPDGWEEKTDPCTTQIYYHNSETNERTWARPGFIPPPPAQRGGPRGPMGGMRNGPGFGPQPTHAPYQPRPPVSNSPYAPQAGGAYGGGGGAY